MTKINVIHQKTPEKLYNKIISYLRNRKYKISISEPLLLLANFWLYLSCYLYHLISLSNIFDYGQNVKQALVTSFIRIVFPVLNIEEIINQPVDLSNVSSILLKIQAVVTTILMIILILGIRDNFLKNTKVNEQNKKFEPTKSL